MRMRSLVLWIWMVFVLGSAGQVEASAFNTARTLKPWAFSLGLEPQLMLGGSSPPPARVYLRAGIGIVQALDLQLYYGLPISGGAPSDLGFDVEIGLVRERSVVPSLSLTLGGHLEALSRPYFDATLLLSKVLGRLEPYVGLASQVQLAPAPVTVRWQVLGGLNIHIAKVMELLFELDLGLRGGATTASFGVNFYF